MTLKKPITDNGIILFDDYEYLFNLLTDEELGKTLRLLMRNKNKPSIDPTDNPKINNVYNYVMSRIIDYRKKKGTYSDFGKKGGNPALNTLKRRDKRMVKGRVIPTLKLREEKIREDNIIEDKENIKEDCRRIVVKNFDEFWDLYIPITNREGNFVAKGNKKRCFEKFKTLRRDVEFERIKSGLEKYLSYCQANEIQTCGVEVFLNQERYDNDYGTVKKERTMADLLKEID